MCFDTERCINEPNKDLICPICLNLLCLDFVTVKKN